MRWRWNIDPGVMYIRNWDTSQQGWPNVATLRGRQCFVSSFGA